MLSFAGRRLFSSRAPCQRERLQVQCLGGSWRGRALRLCDVPAQEQQDWAEIIEVFVVCEFFGTFEHWLGGGGLVWTLYEMRDS